MLKMAKMLTSVQALDKDPEFFLCYVEDEASFLKAG